MANPEHLEILKQGAEQWNKWREEHSPVSPDLSGANLCGEHLSRAYLVFAKLQEADLSKAGLVMADLRDAELMRADLSGAKLRLADFHGANLSGANLTGAGLIRARLDEANLTGVNLSGAELRWVNLRRADLTEANFTESHTGFTIFADVDLSSAKGLETVRHTGPSTIGIDTIYKSRGKIPEAFLRGCGVPDEFIAYIGSMVGRPIQFYSCFISYSTKDQEFAERLHADLQAKGVRCWFAPEEMKGGRKLHEQIDEAIRLHDKLLLILSEHSMSSNWVKTEIANARGREKREGKQLLFPITLVPFEAIKRWKSFDADIGIDSAREIREYFIPDFSNWKDHDSYQTAFQRLVKDLKAGAGG
jgi:uncharacterized protein YjbI with pentapeptide repeats